MIQRIYTGTTRKEKGGQVTYLFITDKRYLAPPLLAVNLLLSFCLLIVITLYPRLVLPAIVTVGLSTVTSARYFFAGRPYFIRFSAHRIAFPTSTVEIGQLRQISFRKIKLSSFQRYFAGIKGISPTACYVSLQTEFSEIAVPLKLDMTAAENFAWIISRMAWANESRLIPLVSEMEQAIKLNK